jgi:hypothetical protein
VAPPQATQPSDDEAGNVASVQGNVMATRNGVSRPARRKPSANDPPPP